MAYTIDDFTIGDMVIPLSKSYGGSYEESQKVAEYLVGRIKYLYVVDKVRKGTRWVLVLHQQKGPHGFGDYFLPTDVEFYTPVCAEEKQYVMFFAQ